MSKRREFDILIWGATGWAGVHLAEYFVTHYPPSAQQTVRWGLVGRSLPKLEGLRQRLMELDSSCSTVELIIADNNDQSQVDAAVARTAVVASTAGPYGLVGEPVVRACVRLGTHYCDLTGESVWIRKMIDRYHEQAADAGVWIVPSCGFDSVPSDLGTLMMMDHLQQQQHGGAVNVTACVTKFGVNNLTQNSKAQAGGGTISSLAIAFATSWSAFFNPNLLVPKPYPTAPSSTPYPSLPVSYLKALKIWSMPWLMAWVNDKVVYRSNYLLNERYGAHFRYRESMAAPNAAVAVVVSGVYLMLLGLAMLPGGVSLIRRLSPAQSQTPPRKPADYKPGLFELTLVAESAGRSVMGVVAGIDEPGFVETAKMLGESAVLLATQLPQLAKLSGLRGGLLTPACMGQLLIARLKVKGMTFEVKDT